MPGLPACAAVLGAVLAASGCTNVSADPPVGSPVASSTPVAPPLQPSATVEGHTDEDAELEPARPVPIWDAQSQASAADAAARLLRAFARPDLDAASWWAQLQPLLTPTAAAAYEFTDPANVPVRTVTAAPSEVTSSSAYLAQVTVPTDVGPYVVLLAREGAGEPWLAERITPPGTVGP